MEGVGFVEVLFGFLVGWRILCKFGNFYFFIYVRFGYKRGFFGS